MNAKIYHNPGCSKSRATLALLEARGIPVDIIEYLKDAPTASSIRNLLRQLEMSAAEIVRTGETAFKESGLTVDSPPDQLIGLIAREPIVLERPIVVFNGKARIGRPPEQVLELFA